MHVNATRHTCAGYAVNTPRVHFNLISAEFNQCNWTKILLREIVCVSDSMSAKLYYSFRE